MWSKEERTRSYFTSTLKEATSLGQMAMIIQDTGSGPSLSDVTTLLDARLGLRQAYNDMAREARDFVNNNSMFVEHPHFYDELIDLIHTTGDSVDEALSMSRDYLCNIGNIEGTFHTSAAICSQLSSQIARLTSKKDLSSDEIRELEGMKERSRRIFQRMEDLLTKVTHRARAGKDTITFPKLYDQVQSTRLAIAQTHVPSKNRAQFPTTTTAGKPANKTTDAPKNITDKPTEHNCAGCNKKLNPIANETIRVKAVITEVPKGDCGTPQKGQEITTNRYVERDDTPRRIQRGIGTMALSRPLGIILRPTGYIRAPQRQRVTPPQSMRLTTAGDRLVPLQKNQQQSGDGTETEDEIQYIPYRPYTKNIASAENILHHADGSQRDSTKQTPAGVEVIDITEETHDRPSPFRRPTPRRRQRLHEIVLEDIARREKANDTPPSTTLRETYDIEAEMRADEIKRFLTPFKHGFHREILTGTREEQTMIHYIAPNGTRISSKRDLNPYIEEYRDISQDNFNFKPVKLQIKDPLQKYQSTRPIPTPTHRSNRCPQWLHEVDFKDNTPRQPKQQGEVKPRRLMDIKLDISKLPQGYLWQLDQKRRQSKAAATKTTPEFNRDDDGGQKPPTSLLQGNDRWQSKYTTSNKRPMRGVHNVMNYKDEPPDEHNRYEWP